jgi:ribonuclease R
MPRKKKTGIKGKKLPPKELKRQITFLFRGTPKKRYTPKQIIKKLKIDNNVPSVYSVLQKMTEENKLIAMADGRFRLNKYADKSPKVHTQEGIVDMTRGGSAFINCDDLTQDVFVSSSNLNTAINGDRVRIVITNARRGRRPEGVITEVLERASKHFIGTIHVSKRFAFVIPDVRHVARDIFVPLKDSMDSKDGEKVVVSIVDWSEGSKKSPIGKVTATLGSAGSSDIAMKSILINNGFDIVFPERVEAEAEAIPDVMEPAEIERRRDMREVTTFTIDPDTAKDFDDALSIQWLDNGHYEIGIHIADVSHYVCPGTHLDKEALERSTSVYLVDRVAPMLPEKLSNGLCSLRPNEDKFTFSAVFTFDKNDKIIKRWFGRTVTHSDRRFTYEEAQEVLETKEGDYVHELLHLNRVAHVLRKAKFKNGAIAFESDEVKFKLDEEGTPLYVYKKERKDAHMLIEDFMLLANKEVARFISEKGRDQGKEIPFVYRTHDSPDPGKLADFALFAKQFGYTMDLSTPQGISKAFSRLVKDAREREELKILEPLAIRTMAKAEYTTDNIGHYGLAFEYYTHFTSPIRRYSDVLVHRLLAKNLEDKTFRTDKELLETQCKHISTQERKAMAAERESVKYKQVEFIKEQVGQVFAGIVSGMIDRGFFVELMENRCEGMVPFSTLDERYVLQEGGMTAKGMLSGDIIKMGDILKVSVAAADLDSRRIDLRLVAE